MDTLYLVFKHRFQIVFGFALQTLKLRPKQTRTLTYEPKSVKPTSNLCWSFFLANKKRRFLTQFQRRKATLCPDPSNHSRLNEGTGIIGTIKLLSSAVQKTTRQKPLASAPEAARRTLKMHDLPEGFAPAAPL
jgi:hypothetical protein